MSIKDYLKRGIRFIIKGVPIVKTNVMLYQIDQKHIFDGKSFIVTGGSSGIGYEIANKIIQYGGTVLITGRNEGKLNVASTKLGKNCYSLVFDSSNIDNCDVFIENAHKILNGDVDGLICNAGVSLHEKNIFHVSIEGYKKQFATNLDGYYFLVQAYLKAMDKRNSHNVLMISSERGIQCDDVPYGLTKAAINSLVKGLNRRFYSSGVRVNAIAPGVTLSEMNPEKISRDNMYTDRISSNRYFLPEEIAEVAAFSLSDAAKCISGEVIACDAGNYLDSYITGI